LVNWDSTGSRRHINNYQEALLHQPTPLPQPQQMFPRLSLAQNTPIATTIHRNQRFRDNSICDRPSRA